MKRLLVIALLVLVVPSFVQAQTNYTIWPASAVPSAPSDSDTLAVELGVKFRADSNGYVNGIRFYKGAGNTGTHTGTLWSSTGTKLATATFTGETASGWQQVNFAAPVAIQANTIYVASYHTNVGHYSDDAGYFATAGVDNPPLHALADGVSDFNGVYAYGTNSVFPTQGWNSSNYWVDVVFSTTFTPDTTPPSITAFSIPVTASTLTIPITSFTASDNVAVTGYMVNESATPPSAAASEWSATPPAFYTFTSAGSKTIYAWAKDAAGNVSASKSTSITITLTDTTPPTVTAFTIPATTTTLIVPITSFTASDNVAVTGYMVNESATPPSAAASEWSATTPTSYTFTTAGTKTLYAWAKDAAGNVSVSRSATVTITLSSDTTKPTVTSFTLPTTSTTLTVPITSFTATDNVGVTGYLAKTSSTTPSAAASGWSATPPASYIFTSAGTKTLYAWAKDAAGNVSARKSAKVSITLPVVNPEPAGWYAGDMHVHRSCGGSPESVSSLYNKMSTNNLAIISLLADMGNGEVQDPTTDLSPNNLYMGQDDPISTPGRIVHWDAEWHWDATYGQYAHQALGGHLVALGLTEAHQIWEEYTYPIFNWAHGIEQNGAYPLNHGIAGFVHMQYLDDSIPQSLDCCKPIEYPVEVALGTADFIAEDVTGSDFAIEAYYRLLNTGFRPRLVAGTDYPCGVSELGSLLTYVKAKVAGDQTPLTYGEWIEGIKQGRTVISRNGHKEFLDLIVNNSAMPGDEINLTGSDNRVSAQINWTANQNLSGTIELVQNGVVIASQPATAARTANWTATVNFAKSGWLAARRMDNNGHQVHTGAVFVIVNNAPVRASAADAQFYVDWMDNLLNMTKPGGAWNSYFSTSLSAAQARYQAARAVFLQRAVEADAVGQ